MLWPASICLQRPTPRSEAVMTGVGRSRFLSDNAMSPADSLMDQKCEWWRS